MAGLPDVVVVGGGVVGAAAAYGLCRRGLAVTLVDRRHTGWASGAGAGILSPETSARADPAWRALALAAGRHHRVLRAELAEAGTRPTGFAECGLVRVALSEGEVPFFEEQLARLGAEAPGALTEIEPDEARRLFPPLGVVHRAAYAPRGARVDGRRLCRALLEAARRRGLVTLDKEVTGFEGAAGTLTAVVAGGERLACGAAALCGGAWSEGLGRALGAPLAVSPLKGQIVHLHTPAPHTGTWPVVQPVLGYYLVPWPRGKVACGGTMEAAAGFDASPTAAGLHELLREALRLAPGLSHAAVSEVRVGLRPMAADDAPVLGRLPGWDNVATATGLGTEGLLLGPFCGELLAASLTGEAPWLDLSAFDPSRPSVAPGSLATWR